MLCLQNQRKSGGSIAVLDLPSSTRSRRFLGCLQICHEHDYGWQNTRHMNTRQDGSNKVQDWVLLPQVPYYHASDCCRQQPATGYCEIWFHLLMIDRKAGGKDILNADRMSVKIWLTVSSFPDVKFGKLSFLLNLSTSVEMEVLTSRWSSMAIPLYMTQ